MVIKPYNPYINLYAKNGNIIYLFSVSRKSNLCVLCPILLTNVRTTICFCTGALTTWWSSLLLIYGHRKIKRGLFSFCNCLMSELAFHPGMTDQLSIYSLLLDPLPVVGEGTVSFDTHFDCQGDECPGSCMPLSFQPPPWKAGNSVPAIGFVPHQLALTSVHSPYVTRLPVEP